MTTPVTQAGPRQHSRRGFLALLTLSAAAVAALTPWLARLGKIHTPLNSATQEFPGPDSIFHPAQDPRLDSRRN